MKMNWKRITSFFTALLIAVLVVSGCAPTVDQSDAAYLEVEKGLHWKNLYQIGDALSLDGLTVKYFRDIIESNDFEIVTLTNDMISGFDTSKEGSFTMTITYHGKTATVDYTVAPGATPFAIRETFCIGENTVVSIDSASMTATVLVFDHYFKALENQPTKTEENALSYLVNRKGKTCVSFAYDGANYEIYYDDENEAYFIKTVSLGENNATTTEQLAHTISLDALQAPQKNVVYQSKREGDIYYSIKIDDSYGAVVTKHTVNGDTTVDTVLDRYRADDATLTANGLFRYAQRQDSYYATATLSAQGQFKIRKDADGVLEAVYSALCTPVA